MDITFHGDVIASGKNQVTSAIDYAEQPDRPRRASSEARGPPTSAEERLNPLRRSMLKGPSTVTSNKEKTNTAASPVASSPLKTAAAASTCSSICPPSWITNSARPAATVT